MEVKWIKIVTNIFDDEKIKYIESLPNGDETIVIWFRILCLSGKSNSGGLLMMTDRIAYTEDMLSSIFQRNINSIQLALNIFESLEMIERYDNKIYLNNWNKYQSLDYFEKKKIYDREFHKKKREEKLLISNNIESYDNRTKIVKNRTKIVKNRTKIVKNRDTDIDIDIDIDIKDKDKKLAYGKFKNVKLKDNEYKKLEDQRLLNLIENLDLYIESKGINYKSHYATILSWDRKEKSKKEVVKSNLIPLEEIYELYNPDKDDIKERDRLLEYLKKLEGDEK